MVRARRSNRSAKSDEAADAVVEAAPEELAAGDDAMEEGAESDAAAVIIEHKTGDGEAEDKSYESEAAFEVAAESTAQGEKVKRDGGPDEVNEAKGNGRGESDKIMKGDCDSIMESESVAAPLERLEAVPSDVIEGAEKAVASDVIEGVEKAVASEGIEEAATSDVIEESAGEEASFISDVIKKEELEDDEVKGLEDLSERCLYCEVGDFSCASVSAYSLHLAAAHGVTRNARLLAKLTVDTHRQGNTHTWGECVNPYLCRPGCYLTLDHC